ncbi:hypothetical protein MA16_Dca004941 [Dendrobium catenatum]|uniref:Uncharacterized protein n=1 Tax=Dendrobium catenatum TaxID=906689 RepID=A0A2I0WGF4_9ASPA|nr:hypothetical protein MA16_Dca004941 [Dendrobium catenatum]
MGEHCGHDTGSSVVACEWKRLVNAGSLCRRVFESFRPISCNKEMDLGNEKKERKEEKVDQPNQIKLGSSSDLLHYLKMPAFHKIALYCVTPGPVRFYTRRLKAGRNQAENKEGGGSLEDWAEIDSDLEFEIQVFLLGLLAFPEIGELFFLSNRRTIFFLLFPSPVLIRITCGLEYSFGLLANSSISYQIAGPVRFYTRRLKAGRNQAENREGGGSFLAWAFGVAGDRRVVLPLESKNNCILLMFTHPLVIYKSLLEFLSVFSRFLADFLCLTAATVENSSFSCCFPLQF